MIVLTDSKFIGASVSLNVNDPDGLYGLILDWPEFQSV